MLIALVAPITVEGRLNGTAVLFGSVRHTAPYKNTEKIQKGHYYLVLPPENNTTLDFFLGGRPCHVLYDCRRPKNNHLGGLGEKSGGY